MQEDIEEVASATEDVTTAEDTSYQEILAGEGEAPDSALPGKVTEEETTSEAEKPTAENEPSEQGAEFNPDEEVTLEIGGKTFTLKQGQVLDVLENQQALVDREKELSEKEKSLNKDYTQKSQANAEFRKSIESNFGRFPEADELQALGTVWKAYFDNPQVKDTIDRILSGDYEAQGGEKGATGSETPEVTMLKREIAGLKSQLGEFVGSLEQQKIQEQQAESQKLWDSWVAKKAEDGIKITEEIDQAMSPFVSAIKQKHPEWDANRILDEAYRHANIDNLEKDSTKKVLKNVDDVKKKGSIKITPRSTQKPESEMSYAEIIQNAG